jgi:hypothetical protein
MLEWIIGCMRFHKEGIYMKRSKEEKEAEAEAIKN